MKRFALFFLMTFAVITFPMKHAFAQVEPLVASDATQPVITATTPVPDEVGAAVHEMLGAAHAGKPALAVVGLLILLSVIVRKFGSKIPGKVGLWLASPTATWVLPMVASVLGMLFSSLKTGATVSIDLLISAVLLGLAGGGVGAGAAATKKAEADGKAAADAAVPDKEAALKVLGNGPQP